MLQDEQINRLKELKQLLDSGVLSEKEFESEKAKIMDEAEKVSVSSDRGGVDSFSALLEGAVSYVKQHKLLVFQVLFLLASILVICIDDDPVCCILSALLAVIAIILSWIKKGRIPRKYAIVSTIVSLIVVACAYFEWMGYF